MNALGAARALTGALLLLAMPAALGPSQGATGAPVPTAPTAAYPREEPFVVRPFRPYLGDRWIGEAIAYGPHRDGQRPDGPAPSRAEVREDLRLVSRHWSLVRLYGASGPADTVLQVIHDERLPVRVLLGVWIAAEERRDSTGRVLERFPAAVAANRREIEAAVVASRRYPDLVLALCVGNETQIFWSAHRVPAERLVAAIRELRARTRLPVTTGDDYNYWNKPESRALASELDFVVTHLHPLWNGSQLDGALEWIRTNLSAIRARHPDREVIIGESGWATLRNDQGDQGKLMKGALGEAEQAAFHRQVSAWVKAEHVPTFFFEAFDENWKGGSDPADVEKHWGFFRADRTPKLAVAGGSDEQ